MTARLRQVVGMVIGFVMTVFMVLLFMELRLARTMRALAEKMAIGILFRVICIQELYPVLLTGYAGCSQVLS